jgi:beta-alanine degradation protein BauB
MKNLGRLLVVVQFTTLFLLLAAGTALAQDVVKVAPESHQVLLENDQVRVLKVHIKVGEKVHMHSHPASVVYFLSDGKLKISFPDGKQVVRDVKAGTSAWNDAATHAVENVGATEFLEVQIELKDAAKKPATTM